MYPMSESASCISPRRYTVGHMISHECQCSLREFNVSHRSVSHRRDTVSPTSAACVSPRSVIYTVSV